MAHRVRAIACLVLSVAAPASAQGPPADYGRGVAALHHFEYEEANEAFRRAQQTSPGFAMAYWGEAMTYHQTLWRNENIGAGREALNRLGSTPAARAARATTDRERAFIAAVDALFAGGDGASRRRAYAEAMGALYARDPDDPDVAAFYALALLGTMSRSLIGGTSAHEGHSASLAGSDTQRRVAEILGRVLVSHPEHPGALHYLLHNYDDPEHARLALPAARTYARVAPASSSHARHMPAHIFVQLGMWAEAEAADRAAFAASDAWVKSKGLGLAHAQLSRAVVASVRAAAARTLSRGVGHARRAGADGQGQRRPHPAERPVIDAGAVCGRDATLGHPGQRRATSATSTNCSPLASVRRARATPPSRSWRARDLRHARNRSRKATSGRPWPSWSVKWRP